MKNNYFKLKKPVSEMTVEELTELQGRVIADFQEYAKKLSLKPTSEISLTEIIDARVNATITCVLVKAIEKKKIEKEIQEDVEDE